jgi:hypothetical protein
MATSRLNQPGPKRRRDKRLRMSHLSDDGRSRATVWNIERRCRARSDDEAGAFFGRELLGAKPAALSLTV